MRLLRSLWFVSLCAASFSAGCVVKEKELCSGAFEPDNDACSLQFCESEKHATDEACIALLNKLRDAGFLSNLDAMVDGVDGADGSMPPATDRDGAGNESDGATGAPSCSANDACDEDKPLCLGHCSPCTEDKHCEWRKDTPVCDGATGACVACTADKLGACEAQGSVCGKGENRCVACNVNSQCTNPSASVCSPEHECVRCDESETATATEAQCHLTGLPLCLAGTCVACQPGKLEACGGKACDMVSGATPVCSGKAVHSANVCEPCVSDEHCAEGQACVRLPLEGENVGWFCQWKKGPAPGRICGSSDRPYVDVKSDAISADSKTPVEVCSLKTTTCPALASHGDFCGRHGERAASQIVTQLPHGAAPSDVHPDSEVCGPRGACLPRTGSLGSVDPDGVYRCRVACTSANKDLDCPSDGDSTCKDFAIGGGGGYCSI